MIIALMADKGGVGKTTAAHNLGAELCRHGSVLLIDADKQGRPHGAMCGHVSAAGSRAFR
jgi:Mrp family chromosome partitioning ATPase